MDLIITHAHCPDGWCAAFIASKCYPEAEIMPLDHGTPVPFDAVCGREVLVLDFSWPAREDNIKLHEIAKSLHIFDHHKSALEKIGNLPFATFDMRRSGAGLTWDYLFGRNTIHACEDHGECRPWYVNYVEDRDLWNWALPHSKEVNAYLMSLPMTLEAWSELDKLTPEYARQAGEGILRHIDRYVREACQEVQRGFIQTSDNTFLTCEVVNAPYMNCSEIGNVLAQRAGVGLTWFERKDGIMQFSLRSQGDVDVSKIAHMYIGGGHRHAAGFRLNVQEGRKLLDKILGR